jgi:hypothetical protein
MQVWCILTYDMYQTVSELSSGHIFFFNSFNDSFLLDFPLDLCHSSPALRMLGSQYRANEGFQFFFSFLLGNLSANSHRKMISDRHRTP